MSDAEARLNHIREVNKARAKRFYEANKADIANKRKEKRDACRQALSDDPPAPAQKSRLRGIKRPVPAKEEAPQAPAPAPAPKPRLRVKKPVPAKEDAPPAPAPSSQRTIASTTYTRADLEKMNWRKQKETEKKPISLERVAEGLGVTSIRSKTKNALIEAILSKNPVQNKNMTFEDAVGIIDQSDQIVSDSSRAIYRNHLKTVVEILACKDIISCFQDALSTIQKLDDAKQKKEPTKSYSLNSKKAYVQMILKLSDVLSIPLSKETKQQYVDAFDALKLDSKDQTKARQEEAKESKEEALTFETYLPKVEEKFGKDSKEYLVASLYSIHGFRDNLQLRLVKQPDDKGDNQIFMSRKGPIYSIQLNDYKTSDKYGSKTIVIPSKIGVHIASYIVKNKIGMGNYLFGNQKLSGFIGKFNKELGLPISINNYREMLVAPVIDSMSSKERVQLAKRMGHAPATSEHYRTKTKKK